VHTQGIPIKKLPNGCPIFVHTLRKIGTFWPKTEYWRQTLMSSTMDQRLIDPFFAKKGLSAQEVHDELVTVLGLDAIAYSPITKYRRQQHFTAISSEPPDEPLITIIGHAILDAAYKQSFSSIRELAKLTCIPKTMVHRYVTSSLGFVAKHLHWVPHELTETQEGQRISLSNQFLCELR
jgi:hypothetical protein